MHGAKIMKKRNTTTKRKHIVKERTIEEVKEGKVKSLVVKVATKKAKTVTKVVKIQTN